MGDRPQNTNERRLEQLRAMRDAALPEPTPQSEIAQLEGRVAELEAEVQRLRELLRATRPKPDNQRSSATSPVGPN